MPILIIFVAHWYLSLFSQTFFLHRYAAHGMFTMSKGWEKYFFIFTWLSQGSSYLSARAYGIMHRLHHAYADTEKDPHSPSHDKNIMAMMYRTFRIYTDIFYDRYPVENKYKKEVPDWPPFDFFASHVVTRVLFGAAFFVYYWYFATEWWMFLLLPIHWLMGPVHGVIINWYAHKFGYKNHEMTNTATNLMPWDLLMMGEGLHNNHHKHASNPKFSAKKYEFDPTYPIIWILDKLGIIRLADKS